MKLSGRVWKLGQGVAATDLLPARHDKAAMTGQAEECAKHVLEDLRPDFQIEKRQGDLIVGAQNLGTGHAHYYRGAVIGCRAAGVAALLADKISGLFLRTAIDDGYPVWAFPGIHDFVDDGDQLEIDLSSGESRNLTQGTARTFPPMAATVLDIIKAGSSIQWARRRVGAAAA